MCVGGGWGIALLSPFSCEVAMCLRGGGGLHCYNHFLELKFRVCVWGGGGGALVSDFYLDVL